MTAKNILKKASIAIVALIIVIALATVIVGSGFRKDLQEVYAALEAADCETAYTLAEQVQDDYRSARKVFDLIPFDRTFDELKNLYPIRSTCTNMHLMKGADTALEVVGYAAGEITDLSSRISREDASLIEKLIRLTSDYAMNALAQDEFRPLAMMEQMKYLGMPCGNIFEFYYYPFDMDGTQHLAEPLLSALEEHITAFNLACAKYYFAEFDPDNLRKSIYGVSSAQAPARSLELVRIAMDSGLDDAQKQEADELLVEIFSGQPYPCDNLILDNEDSDDSGELGEAYAPDKTPVKDGDEWQPYIEPLLQRIYEGCTVTLFEARNFLQTKAILEKYLGEYPGSRQAESINRFLYELPIRGAIAVYEDGDIGKSRRMFEEVVSEYPGTALSETANEYLARITDQLARNERLRRLKKIEGFRYAQSGPARLTIINGSNATLDITLSGPQKVNRRIDGCLGCARPSSEACLEERPSKQFELEPGDYDIRVTAKTYDGTDAESYTGLYELLPGYAYNECLIIETRPQ